MAVKLLLGFLLLVFCGCMLLVVHQLAVQKRSNRLALVRGAPLSQTVAGKAHARIDVGKKLKDSGADKPQRKGGLRDMIQQAGLKISLMQYWLYAAFSAVMVFGFCKLFGLSFAATWLFTLFGLLGLPRFVLRFKAGRRQKRFLTEFPDALDAMVRLLKAGMPAGEAIAMAAREFIGPVGDEMNYLYEQQRIGTPMAEAAERAAQRMPIAEMQMFATALAIQMETGASLSEVLTNLSGVIRARFKLKRKVIALSSEARASAMIIGALPIMVATLLNIVNPTYMDMLFHDRTGNVLLWGCGVWMSLGILVMRQMINFRV